MTRAEQTNLVKSGSETKRTLHQRLSERAESSAQQEVQVGQSEPSVMDEPRRTLSNYERLRFTGDEFSVS